MTRRVLLACVLSLGMAVPADAQQYPARSLKLGGAYATCGWVPTTIAQIPDIALSTPGMIYLNPVLLQMPRPLQLFWYAHECAHQLYGTSEDQADCWAVRKGRDEGWFREGDLGLLRRSLDPNAGPTHLPVHERFALLRRCFMSGTAEYAGPPAQGPGLASYVRPQWQFAYQR